MILLNESNFLHKSKENRLMLVEFYSDLCAPCIRMMPVLEKLEKKIKNDRITFASVNVDDSPVLEQSFNVEATPTFILIKDEKVISKTDGAMSERKLRKFITKSIMEGKNHQ